MDASQFPEEKNISKFEHHEETDTVDPDAKQQLIKQIKKKEKIKQIKQILRQNGRCQLMPILVFLAISQAFLICFLLIKSNSVQNKQFEHQNQLNSSEPAKGKGENRTEIIDKQVNIQKKDFYDLGIPIFQAGLTGNYTGRAIVISDHNNSFIGFLKNGVPNGVGIQFQQNNQFVSLWQNGKKSDRVILQENNSYIFDGVLNNETKVSGFFYSPNWDKFEGTWVNNQKQGQGKIEFSNGEIFEGEFLADKKNGFGIMVYRNGSKYEGEWNLDQRSGQGTFTWVQSNESNTTAATSDNEKLSYKGTWLKDVKHGNGQLTWTNGDFYKGQFEDDHESGLGIKTFKNGDKVIGSDNISLSQYDGQFRHGKFEGEGLYLWKDGHSQIYKNNQFSSYKGSFKNNVKAGFGKQIIKMEKVNRFLKFVTGQKEDIYEGDWFNDMKHGNGEYKYSNGDKYKGQFVEDVKSGSGQIWYYNQDRYQGQWLNDIKEGAGKYFYFNSGNRYEGEFKGDLKEGKGIYHFGNKNYQIGIYKNDKEDGWFDEFTQEGKKIKRILYKEGMEEKFEVI